MIITIFMLVRIVDSEQRSGESGDLAETDEERFMNLSLRLDEDPAVKHDHSSNREDGCRKQLYVEFRFHSAKVHLLFDLRKKIPDFFKDSRGLSQTCAKRGSGIGNRRSYPQN